MADIERLERALVKADAAGDADAARAFAAEIKRIRLEAAPVDAPAPAPKPEMSLGDAAIAYGKNQLRAARDVGAGFVRGTGSVGSTLLAANEAIESLKRGQMPSLEKDRERRASMDWVARDVGADTESAGYGIGKFGAEVAGTAGVGGLLGKGVAAASTSPYAQMLAKSLTTSGFSTGAPAGTNALLNAGTRAIGGGITGGSAGGLVNPEHAGISAGVGMVLPGATQLAAATGNKLGGKLSDAARGLMQSALKPTPTQLKSGDASTAIDMLLQHGINPTKGGVNKLYDMIEGMNAEIAAKIAGSNATISKNKVAQTLGDVRQRFGNQVSPTADLSAIKGVGDDFLNHPNFAGDAIPVGAAQTMKQGTYRVLKNKYGEVGSASSEAQKGLARGLKEEIAAAVPGVQGLNAAESKLLTTLEVTERRALMDMNKNPMGLAALAQSPASWAMFMADKSALFKSLAARMANSSSGGVRNSGNLLENTMNKKLSSAAVPVIASD